MAHSAPLRFHSQGRQQVASAHALHRLAASLHAFPLTAPIPLAGRLPRSSSLVFSRFVRRVAYSDEFVPGGEFVVCDVL